MHCDMVHPMDLSHALRIPPKIPIFTCRTKGTLCSGVCGILVALLCHCTVAATVLPYEHPEPGKSRKSNRGQTVFPHRAKTAELSAPVKGKGKKGLLKQKRLMVYALETS